MRKGRTKPAFKGFPKGPTPKWSKQQLMIKLSNQRQELREPFVYGSIKALYGLAKFSGR